MELRPQPVRRVGSKGIDHYGDAEAPADPSDEIMFIPLSPLARLYIYALHGCLCEVAFTAVWDWLYTSDQRLPGHTSLWALLIYSSAIYFMEGLSAKMQQKRYPLPVRLTIYTSFIYLWEFSWGFLLRLLQACPWDYSGFRYNLMGLVTLEYAAPWALASLIAEKHVIRNTLKIRLRI
ncbi:transmembrane protein 229B [Chanos chanos]|uniref:Transmembrane protein 229B n=1 Tax=Chanos chanos TaxID=29144 RepID=A0A6J2V6R6_CHACN|nr:transmembrane protein 229B-like [Chanos chanos]